MEILKDVLLAIWGFDGVKAIVFSLLFSFAVGVASAIKSESFDARKLKNFVVNKMIPYVIVYAATRILAIYGAADMGVFAPVLDVLSVTVWGVIEAEVAASIILNLEVLGLNIPPQLRAILTPKAE